MTDDADRFAKAFVVHNEMEQTRAYLERGRRFEHMPVEALNEVGPLHSNWCSYPKTNGDRVTNTILEQS